jgi:hypothetical protein
LHITYYVRTPLKQEVFDGLFLYTARCPSLIALDICDIQERLKHEEAVEANNGVWWSGRLRVVAIDEEAAAQKGIKRGSDKACSHPEVPAYECQVYSASPFAAHHSLHDVHMSLT